MTRLQPRERNSKLTAPVPAKRSQADLLGDTALHLVRGDVFRFIGEDVRAYDYVFADPPYDHPRFDEIPELILNSKLVKSGTIVIIEHSKNRDFSDLPGFNQRRAYGSVNFSIFIIPEENG